MSDVREKIRAYIKELENEVKRCETLIISGDGNDIALLSRIETITDVMSDMENILDEMV